MTKSVVTNTAIDIVRRREYVLENSLVRLTKYHTTKFPTWCLPALLLHRDADLEPLMQADLEQIVKPSRLVLSTWGFTQEGIEHAKLCFYPVTMLSTLSLGDRGFQRKVEKPIQLYWALSRRYGKKRGSMWTLSKH